MSAPASQPSFVAPASFSPFGKPAEPTPEDNLASILQSITRIEEKVHDLELIERTLKKEKSAQREDEMNQKLQLRTQRLEKDNLALRTMLAKALELLSGDDE